MSKDEFRPDVGKRFFLQHQAELEQGLRQVAGALGKDQQFQDSADFFRDFINGFWGPYEEVCETGNRRQKPITEEIRSLECQLSQELRTEKWELFERYSDLLAERNSTALDYAFLVGYQCAFRFLMLGLAPVTGDFLRGEEPPEDTPAQTSLSKAEPTDHGDKIYTHDEAALIVELFEDILDAHSIKIPSPENDEREPDNEAKLYGSVYSGLLDEVEHRIVDLLSRAKCGAVIIEDEFSGNI